MMKRIYMQPQTKVVILKNRMQVLMSSPTGGKVYGEAESGSEGFSREFTMDFWDEE